MALVKHSHHFYHFSYPTSWRRHYSSIGLVLLILAFFFLFVFRLVLPSSSVNLNQLSVLILLSSLFFTLFRLTIAYLLALLLAVPMALFVTHSTKTERVFLPIVDIVQSVPVLAFFPVIVLLFIRFNFFEGAAIFILFISMVWNLVFSMIGGLKTIPQDILAASTVFRASGVKRLWFVTLPSILPYIVTGSLLAWGQGWNIVIVAEALHTYIPGGSSSQDLLGLGSLLVDAIASGKTSVFLSALLIIIMVIGTLNFFIWQKLLKLTERYKFD